MLSSESTVRLRRRPLVAALLMTVGLALVSGCGGGSALSTMTPAQEAGFEAMYSQQILFAESVTPNSSFTWVGAQATPMLAACDAADATEPLSASVASACGPLTRYFKLASLLAGRCHESMSVSCSRTLNNMGEASLALSSSTAEVNRQLPLTVTDEQCLDEIGTPEVEVLYYKTNGLIFTRMAKAVESRDIQAVRKEEASLVSEAATLEQVLPRDKTPAGAQIVNFRKACKIEPR